MTRTQFESTSPGRPGVAYFATHTPISGYPYQDAGAGVQHDSGRRTTVIGVTALALIACAFAGVAYLKAQDTAMTAATVPPQAARLLEADVAAAMRLPQVQVPLQAARLLEADVAAAARVPQVQVPHGALDTLN